MRKVQLNVKKNWLHNEISQKLEVARSRDCEEQ